MHDRSASRLLPRCAAWLSLSLGVLLCAGCGQGLKIGGKVVNKTTPIPNAEIRFISVEDRDVVFSSVSNADGSYVLNSKARGGVPKGRYKITVSWYTKRKDGAILGNTEEDQGLKGTGAARRHEAEFDREITDSSDVVLDVSQATKN